MSTYINAMPIAMNMIDNAANIPTPPFLSSVLDRREGAGVDEQIG